MDVAADGGRIELDVGFVGDCFSHFGAEGLYLRFGEGMPAFSLESQISRSLNWEVVVSEGRCK